MSLNAIKVLFGIAAAYDIVLGAVFGLFYRPIYQYVGSVLPNHPGYVQLPAIFVVVFGIGFWMVSRDPVRSASIIPLGILMKLGFCLVVFGHLLFGQSIPFYIPLGVCDAVFLVLFALAYDAVKRRETPSGAAAPTA